jgi:hypothetical protein
MKIDAAMNLVIPVETDKGIVHVHSTPISQQVFENYFIVISKAFAMMHSQGLNALAGPRIALLMLKKVAVDMNVWDTPEGVMEGLIAEIRRLTNVIAPSENGWQTLSFQQCVDRKVIDDRSLSEVENAICFFIIASSMYPRSVLKQSLEGACELWGGQIVSSNSTAFAVSLQTSTTTENTGVTVAGSSVPS